MLRLTLRTDSPARRILAAEGRVVGEWATLLEHECARLVGQGPVLELELRGVVDVDASGIATLRRLRAGAVRLTGCTPILLSLLDEEQSA